MALLFTPSPFSGPLAQRLEQRTHNPLVVGSNPTGTTKKQLSLYCGGCSSFFVSLLVTPAVGCTVFTQYIKAPPRLYRRGYKNTTFSWISDLICRGTPTYFWKRPATPGPFLHQKLLFYLPVKWLDPKSWTLLFFLPSIHYN